MKSLDKIYLVGMPGCGKSTFGKKLAVELNLPFTDLDKFIENKTGTTVAEIFKDHGEDHFRNIERDGLLELIENESSILLATGGGAPCFFDNMDRMMESGIVIFLDQTLEHILERVSRKKAKRPLIEKISDDDLMIELKALYEKRLPFYKKAQVLLHHEEIDASIAVKKLAQFIS